MRKRLILDATKTFECRFSTGIQRVVRELVRRSELIGRQLGVEAVPVVASVRGYHRLDARGLARLLEPVAASSGEVVNQSRLSRRAKELLQGNMRVYAALQRLSMRRQLAKLTAGLDVFPVGPGDVVAVIDDFAGGSPSLSMAGRARRDGATTMAIVYDLIPVLHPEMVLPSIAYLFRRAFQRLAGEVDGLIAISRSGAALIRDQPAVRDAGIPVASFYLGQDVRVADDRPRAATIPDAAWRDGPTFLMVGTIEPRKRHAAVLAAFDRLWDRGVAANLLIIGRIGWEVDALLDAVRAHPRHGSSLFLCHNVEDGELRAAMARADATIMASRAEGFGLPIVESLAFGVPVLASDIPIFREVAGDAGCYFLPDNPDAIAAAVTAFMNHPEPHRAAARAFRWIDWDGSAAEFAAAVQMILDMALVGPVAPPSILRQGLPS